MGNHFRLFLAPAFMSCLLFLGGCREVVEKTYPDGKPMVKRTYGLMGGRLPGNLRHEQTFYFNGKPERDAHFRKGVLDGPYAEFWHNGQKKVVGQYAGGKKQGPWEHYFNQFAVAAKGAYKDDFRDGPWLEYFENGELKAQGDYRQGQESGLWKRWGKKGDLILENTCFESNAEGRYRTFHANNTPKEDYPCRRGVPFGAYARRNMDGDVEERGAFDSTGKKDGVWETLHPGGSPASRRTYRAGIETDSLYAWDVAGRIRERGYFASGAGEIVAYDSLGRISERKRMVAGRPEGEDSTFHANGKPKTLVVYRDGLPVSMRRWHANGTLSLEGLFEGGKRAGEWKQFGDKGQAQDVSRYVDGLLHGERRMYDSTGRLTTVMRYEHGYPAEGKFPGGLKGAGPKGTGLQGKAGSQLAPGADSARPR